MLQNRRSFLKLASALGVSLYAEPLIALPDQGTPWVEDKGDFYILRVPDGKSVSGLELAKPTIIIAGLGSVVDSLDIDSFVNIAAKPGAVIRRLWVDARTSRAEGRQATVITRGDGFLLEDAVIQCSHGTKFGIQVEDCDGARIHGMRVLNHTDPTGAMVTIQASGGHVRAPVTHIADFRLDA